MHTELARVPSPCTVVFTVSGWVLLALLGLVLVNVAINERCCQSK